MEIHFLGSGDAFGSGGRFNSCFQITTDTAGVFLVDCGASSMVAIRQAGIDPNLIRTVFVSHLHGDHFGGLPFLILDAQFYSHRSGPLTLVGPPTLRERLTQAMEVFFPGSSSARRKFEIEVVEIDPGTQLLVNGVELTAFLVDHACGAPPLALRLTVDGKRLAYSGDTVWTESLVEAARGADLFIAEALSYERKIPFHMDYATLKANLARVGAKRVILTHLGPDMLSHAAGSGETVAEDGMVVTI